MKKFISFILLLSFIFLLSSCKDEEPPYVEPLGIVNYTSAEELMSMGTIDTADRYLVESTDKSYDITATYDISQGNAYIRVPGVYKITGTTDKYYVDVYMPDNDTAYSVVLVLDGASLDNANAAHSLPPVYSVGADLTVVLPKNTESAITCGSKALENGAITVKKGNLYIEGSGKLNINATGGKNGIHCTKEATVSSGELNIKAENHGIYGKESLTVLNGVISIESGHFGLKSGDSPSELDPVNDIGSILISGGRISIESTDNGIDVNGTLTVYGSATQVTSGQNAVKANDFVSVGKTGKRTLMLLNSGTDGLDSDTDIEIVGETDIKIISGGDGIVGKSVDISTSGDIHIVTKGEYTESATGDYILLDDGRYIKINPLNYPDSTFYDILVSCKGIKALELIEISGGNIVISAMEDGIHSLDFKMNGGNIGIITDEDGIHSTNTAKFTGGGLDIHKSYKGIKSANVHINDGAMKIASYSDAIDSPKVVFDGGEAYLLDKVDVGTEGEFTVNGGTVVIVASSSSPCLPTKTNLNSVKATVSKPQLAMHTRYLRISGGNIDMTFKLPKGYTEKISVSVISDKLTSGDYNAQIGKFEGDFKEICVFGRELTDGYTQKLIK